MNYFADMHCHILYGVDDGADSIKTSMKMIRYAYSQGIRVIVLTPHRHPVYEKQHLRNELEQHYVVLKEKLREEGIPMHVFLGCECYYREEAVDMYLDGKFPSVNNSRYLLVEFEPDVRFRKIQNCVLSFAQIGVRVIIAHAERYQCLLEDTDLVRNLVDAGAYIQLNAASVSGKVGFGIRRKCRELLERRLVHFVATDAHGVNSRKPDIKKAASLVEKWTDEEYARDILYWNTIRVIKNQSI